MEYIDLTGVCIAILTVIFGVLTYKVWPYLKAILEQKFGNEALKEFLRWVNIFVGAAEMIFKQSGMGEEKKQYVMERIHAWVMKNEAWLEEHGFTIDWEEINDMVEDAVLELNKKNKENK